MQMFHPEIRPLMNMADRLPSHELGHLLDILALLTRSRQRRVCLSCRKRGEMGVDRGIQQQERLV
jgi:hypothetical protein